MNNFIDEVRNYIPNSDEIIGICAGFMIGGLITLFNAPAWFFFLMSVVWFFIGLWKYMKENDDA